MHGGRGEVFEGHPVNRERPGPKQRATGRSGRGRADGGPVAPFLDRFGVDAA